MANSEFPWFRFYARDWLTDSNVMLMSCVTRGAYIQLLAFQWENGAIPGSTASCARLVGLDPKEFSNNVWPFLEELFPVVSQAEAKQKPSSAFKQNARTNKKLADARALVVSEAAEKSARGRLGGLQTQRRRRLKKSKHRFNDTSSTASTTLQASSDADADEEPPTPTSGGPDNPVGVRESGAENPRAAGTNPRAIAAEREAEDRKAQERRRGEVERQLDPGGNLGGTYSGGLGFRLWNQIDLKELESLARKRDLGDQGAPFPGPLAKSQPQKAEGTI